MKMPSELIERGSFEGQFHYMSAIAEKLRLGQELDNLELVQAINFYEQIRAMSRALSPEWDLAEVSAATRLIELKFTYGNRCRQLGVKELRDTPYRTGPRYAVEKLPRK